MLGDFEGQLGEGLSPRLRGNLAGEIALLQVLRSIPAPAGEPPLANQRQQSEEVYPRACGGTRR